MKKAKARYTVRVRSYKGGKMFEIKDEYWDSKNNAFTKPDGAFYSTEDSVAAVLQEAGNFLKEAEPGKVYQLKTTAFPFGVADQVSEVPTHWFHC